MARGEGPKPQRSESTACRTIMDHGVRAGKPHGIVVGSQVHTGTRTGPSVVLEVTLSLWAWLPGFEMPCLKRGARQREPVTLVLDWGHLNLCAKYLILVQILVRNAVASTKADAKNTNPNMKKTNAGTNVPM